MCCIVKMRSSHYFTGCNERRKKKGQFPYFLTLLYYGGQLLTTTYYVSLPKYYLVPNVRICYLTENNSRKKQNNDSLN